MTLITKRKLPAAGSENLTDGIPREVRDIEEFMKKK